MNSPSTDVSVASDPIDFVPATLRPRCDGWTIARQQQFIEALAASGSVRHAAAAVGMSETSAYRLRARARGASFSFAWNVAVQASFVRLEQLAMERARDGTAEPVYRGGVLIGEKRIFSDRLLMFMLKRGEQQQLDLATLISPQDPEINDVLCAALEQIALLDDGPDPHFDDPADQQPALS